MPKELLLFFSKESFPYFLGKRDSLKNLYISGNGSHQKKSYFLGSTFQHSINEKNYS